jgi:hypothetical protein
MLNQRSEIKTILIVSANYYFQFNLMTFLPMFCFYSELSGCDEEEKIK